MNEALKDSRKGPEGQTEEEEGEMEKQIVREREKSVGRKRECVFIRNVSCVRVCAKRGTRKKEREGGIPERGWYIMA